MIIGNFGDTHGIGKKGNVLAKIAEIFFAHNVQVIVLSGDIFPEDFEAIRILFPNAHIICALVEEDLSRHHIKENNGKLMAPGQKWTFTKPSNDIRSRIVRLDDISSRRLSIYVGHRRTDDVAYGSVEKLMQALESIHQINDVCYSIGGHTHRQFMAIKNGLHFINPGAVADSSAFAIIDTTRDETIFSRVPKKIFSEKQLNIGILRNVRGADRLLWKKLTEKFKEKKVSHIITFGDTDNCDIVREELRDFQVYFDPRLIRRPAKNSSNCRPLNNQILDKDYLYSSLNGFSFLIRQSRGLDLCHQSEVEMNHVLRESKVKYPQASFMFCNSANEEVLYEEGTAMRLVDPGMFNLEGRYAIISFPETEITMGKIITT